jgi:nucleoid-associated protein YgaU
MVSTRFGILRFWILVWVIASVGWMFSGCATTPPPPPPGPSAEAVGQRIAALEACITSSQGAIDDALKAGASVGDTFAVSSKIADAQRALVKAKSLLKKGEGQKAMHQANKALEGCNKTKAMAMSARDAALARGKLQAQAEARMGQITPCIEEARRAIQAAEAAGATKMELRLARNNLENAEFIFKDAKALLDKGEPERALTRLELVQSDCLAARDMGNQAGMAAARRAQSMANQYTVGRGDTLWGISGRAPIYDNPFMWPLIYKANRDQIRDPDLIYPRQTFAIPRNYSAEEETSAKRRARTRGPWRLGDGTDYYILEGVRR